MPTVLFALTSHDTLGTTGRKTGFYVPEVAHPAVEFQRSGYELAFVSVAGGAAPQDGVKPEDKIVAEFLDHPVIAMALESTPTPGTLDPAQFDVIFLAGGHGTMWDFPDSAELTALTAGVYEHGGVVAAVCHGPAGLVNVKLSDGTYLVDGKQVSSFTDEEEAAVGLTGVVPFLLESTLTARGAIFTKGPNFQEHAVSDGRLATGQNPASAVAVAHLAIQSNAAATV